MLKSYNFILSQNKMSSKLTKKIVILQNSSVVDYYEAFAERIIIVMCVHTSLNMDTMT